MIVKADLHIHSCLSPCANLEMSPSRIVEEAVRAGLGLIAISDHHSCLNCTALDKICASRSDIRCLFGMEIATAEEIHVLSIFDNLSLALEFGKKVYASLPSLQNDPERYGDQVYVDENDVIVGEVENYIGGDIASSYSLEALIPAIHRAGGLAIPSHIDRPYFSILSQLGYIPLYDYDAIEVTPSAKSIPVEVLNRYPVIYNSDSHVPETIGKTFHELEFDCGLKEIGIAELKKAFEKRIKHPA
ncbi:MAG: hypothetical protein A2Y33_04320 [Spirochaetes bacterium GWF1_51_8]|nr:MAG: hypothetical protein A2Y33_04320 [Spirochaetes bacterium GWF1_51_8]